MKKSGRILCVALAAAVALTAFSFAQDDDASEKKPKHTIKDVMKIGHKDGLLKKILAGDADQKEKLELLDLYVSLVESKPELGDQTSWQKLAGGAALAAAKVAVGREGATDELKVATNCAACHKVHKPKS